MQTNYVIMCTEHMMGVVPMDEFIRDNAQDEEVMAKVPELLAGAPVTFGGGAIPEVECIPFYFGHLC